MALITILTEGNPSVGLGDVVSADVIVLLMQDQDRLLSEEGNTMDAQISAEETSSESESEENSTSESAVADETKQPCVGSFMSFRTFLKECGERHKRMPNKKKRRYRNDSEYHKYGGMLQRLGEQCDSERIMLSEFSNAMSGRQEGGLFECLRTPAGKFQCISSDVKEFGYPIARDKDQDGSDSEVSEDEFEVHQGAVKRLLTKDADKSQNKADDELTKLSQQACDLITAGVERGDSAYSALLAKLGYIPNPAKVGNNFERIRQDNTSSTNRSFCSNAAPS